MGDPFKALADPTRRAILDELVLKDGQSLFEICSRLAMRHGTTSTRQAISQHLAVLEEADLVRTHRDGRTKVHQLNTNPLRSILERWPVNHTGRTIMPRINLASVLVDDQTNALDFYTDKLGFVAKTDVDLGEFRWLTVVGAGEPDGVELLLEPDAHPAAKAFKQALVEDGIPFTSFAVDDVYATYRDLRARGVTFRQPPAEMGTMTTAVLDDTCGNLIQIMSPA